MIPEGNLNSEREKKSKIKSSEWEGGGGQRREEEGKRRKQENTSTTRVCYLSVPSAF